MKGPGWKDRMLIENDSERYFANLSKVEVGLNFVLSSS
jgi:hypothetical protein